MDARHPPAETCGISAADYTAQAIHSLLEHSTTTNELTLATANTDKPFCTLQNQPNTGEGVQGIKLRTGDRVLMIANAAITRLDEVSPAAGGRVATNDSTSGDQILGIALNAASAQLDLVLVEVMLQTQE